ncbi:MAG: glycosylhydrolase-like jelly roll fold domain-containing protein [Acidobacteriaceae bacterium]
MPVSFTIADGRTTVPLNLEAWGTVFVVFRKPTSRTSWTAPAQVEKQLATVNGPWKVSFPPDWGAPPSITLDSLSSWSTNGDDGVKYFSGIGTYRKTVNVPASWLHRKAHIWLDLGDVKNLAEVSVDGKSFGVVWHAPYRVDVTSALHPGSNQLSIKVTNAWVNRLIGDQQPNATKKYTFTDVKPYRADSPLLPSGLLGPVEFQSVATE